MHSAPDYLDQAAQEKWQQIMAKRQAWKPLELDQLAAYCANWSRWRRAESALATMGDPVVTIEDDKGGVKSHGPAPEIKIAESAAKEMQRLARALRLGRLK